MQMREKNVKRGYLKEEKKDGERTKEGKEKV